MALILCILAVTYFLYRSLILATPKLVLRCLYQNLVQQPI